MKVYQSLAGSSCLVSIVVVSWNTRDLLRGCVASALAACAELKAAFEVIVVDNASADGSSGMIRDEFPQVRLIANASNRGFAAATNQGIRVSQGRYVMLLNPDTSAAPSFLRELVVFADAHADAGAVGPRLVGSRGEDQVSCFPLPTITRELWRLFHLDRIVEFASYPASRLQAGDPQSVESIQGACMLVRREAFAQAGLLDERFFIYTEEIDFCRRLLDLGWRIYWVPGARVVHHGAASTAQVSARMFLELYRSKVQYFRKHLGRPGAIAYKGVLLAAALPRVILPGLAMAFVPSRRDEWLGVIRKYSSLVAELPAL